MTELAALIFLAAWVIAMALLAAWAITAILGTRTR